MGRAGHAEDAGVVDQAEDQPHRLVNATDHRADGGLAGVADPERCRQCDYGCDFMCD
jgi:hypothetical protein